jgi:hypothetical protein
MSRIIDKDKDQSGLFTVVGAPYVAEKHSDGRDHLHHEPPSSPWPPEAGIAVLWLIAYAVIFGAALFTNGVVGKAVAFAVACLK